jgi:class 3 adenylate cyclase
MVCGSCGAPAADGSRFCAMCGTPLSGPGVKEARKNVATLFIDMVGSTAIAGRLDPEALRMLVDGYFERCTGAIWAHGGVIEKFIGDAVLAVFGATIGHEDDALRAVRAAVDALGALADLNADLVARQQETLQVRCGISFGEVLALTSSGGDVRIVGDAVNTASRLQTAAAPGEILIDATTASLVKGVVAIEPVPPLALRGKPRPVRAWRIIATASSTAAAATHAPLAMIGRQEQLEQLRQAYRRVTSGPQPGQVTILGEAGIGKSRLVREFLADLPRRPDGRVEATVLGGRCSAYGRGITYRPLAEVARSWPGGWPALEELMRADPVCGGPSADRLGTIVTDAAAGSARLPQPGPAPGGPGAAGSAGTAGVEELAWAARCMLGLAARSGPVVVVWDDLHRAEPTLLDLIDDVATWLAGVPVLQICTARPELLEIRPAWAGGTPAATAVQVLPLTPEQSAELVTALAGRDDRAAAGAASAGRGEVAAHAVDLYARASAECGGNPLFAELLVEVLAEAGPEAVIPPTIGAVLGARLDQLPARERDLLDRAAVIGRDFDWRQLLALWSGDGLPEADVRAGLTQLIRRGFLQDAGTDGALRFTQAMLRDIAYSCVPKTRRERWHQAMADWFARQDAPEDAGALALACHVESARQLRRELRPGDASLPGRAPEAARALIRAGERALARQDLPAAAGLLERGRELLAPGDAAHVPVALHIADACGGMWDGERALAALVSARTAVARGSCELLTCEIGELILGLRLRQAEPEMVRARSAQIAAELAATSAPGHELARCRLGQLAAYLDFAAERAGDAVSALRRAVALARALGDGYEEERILCAICELAQWSPDTVGDGLALCRELAARFAANRALRIPVLLATARLSVLGGDVAAARAAVESARRHAGDLHLDLAAAATCELAGFVEMLAGAPGSAVAQFRRAEAMLLENGQLQDASTLRAAGARALFEAGQPAAAAAAIAGTDAGLDLRTGVMVTSLEARIAGGPGGVRLAEEAVRLADLTQDPCLQGDARLDLALVLADAGRPAAAAAAGQEATARYRAKGATLLAARVPALLPPPGPRVRSRPAPGPAGPAESRPDDRP